MTQIGKMIFDDGFRAGEAKGEERGEIRKVVELSCRKLRKGKTPQVIAEELEEEPEMIRSICQAASRFAPDYDWDQVYGAWSSRAEQGAPSVLREQKDFPDSLALAGIYGQ